MTDQPVYVSAEGLQKMKKELEYLTGTKKKEVADRIEKAKELGDLKENAEYHDAKDEMGWVMGRAIQLQDQIARAQVVEKGNGEEVSIGSTVKVEVKGKEKEITIVGATEADPSAGRISNEGPVGMALIGHKKGETVTVQVPAGEVEYKIIDID